MRVVELINTVVCSLISTLLLFAFAPWLITGPLLPSIFWPGDPASLVSYVGSAYFKGALICLSGTVGMQIIWYWLVKRFKGDEIAAEKMRYVWLLLGMLVILSLCIGTVTSVFLAPEVLVQLLYVLIPINSISGIIGFWIATAISTPSSSGLQLIVPGSFNLRRLRK